MEEEIVNSISNGDITILKSIPKHKLNSNITKILMNKLKGNLTENKNKIAQLDGCDHEFQNISYNFYYQNNNIEKCIEYLEKIK